MKQIGLYIHIPFCVKKCNYCDFLSAPANEQVQKFYLDVLQKEIKQKAKDYIEYEVDTIFIGGGTPTSVPYKEMEQVLATIQKYYRITKDCEITMECNPGSVSKEALAAYKKAGINRLSIGLQSADDEMLKILGRIHTYEQFLETFSMARETGFQNVNIDIMSALPKQTLQGYEDTLNKVIQLKPEHISAYSLIVEENTPFYEMALDNKLSIPPEEIERDMYYKTKEILENNGYLRYEISNYAKDGYACRHNIRYWTRQEYLGLGLGASSFIKNSRFKNVDKIFSYFEEENYMKRYEEEFLTKEDCMEEFMFLGLRMTEGVLKKTFEKCFDKSIEEVYGSTIQKLKMQGLIEETQDRIALTDYGIDVSNMVLAEFLL